MDALVDGVEVSADTQAEEKQYVYAGLSSHIVLLFNVQWSKKREP